MSNVLCVSLHSRSTFTSCFYSSNVPISFGPCAVQRPCFKLRANFLAPLLSLPSCPFLSYLCVVSVCNLKIQLLYEVSQTERVYAIQRAEILLRKRIKVSTFKRLCKVMPYTLYPPKLKHVVPKIRFSTILRTWKLIGRIQK